MILWTFLISNLSKIGIGIAGIFGIVLLGKNSKLTQENARLQGALKANDKIIDIQKKVIYATKDTDDVSLNDNITRVQNDKI